MGNCEIGEDTCVLRALARLVEKLSLYRYKCSVWCSGVLAPQASPARPATQPLAHASPRASWLSSAVNHRTTLPDLVSSPASNTAQLSFPFSVQPNLQPCSQPNLQSTTSAETSARLGRGRVLSWTSANQFATVGDVLARYHNLHLQQNHMPPKTSLFDQYPRRESSIKLTNSPQRLRPQKLVSGSGFESELIFQNRFSNTYWFSYFKKTVT